MTLDTLARIIEFKDEYDPGLIGIGYDIENEWFGSVDAEVLWGMLRLIKPNRMIEVGSGESTKISIAALQRNGKGRFTAIDPSPRVPLPVGVDHIRENVETVDRGVFVKLLNRDVLFIDTSHILRPGNDVDCLYNGILPTLGPGVIVHCHDIFLPDAYPWNDRGYNEQEIVQGIIDTGKWTVLWSSHQMQKEAPDRLAEAFASYTPDRYPGSLWMRRR